MRLLEKQMYTLRETQHLTEKFTEFLKILRKITKNYQFFRKTPIGPKTKHNTLTGTKVMEGLIESH